MQPREGPWKCSLAGMGLTRAGGEMGLGPEGARGWGKKMSSNDGRHSKPHGTSLSQRWTQCGDSESVTSERPGPLLCLAQ